MKNTVSLLVYLITFIAMYFVLSLFGSIVIGCDYSTAIESRDWFVLYFLFIGWWVAIIPAVDAYESFKKRERA